MVDNKLAGKSLVAAIAIDLFEPPSNLQQQIPFQPSSTTNDENGRRYLVWNSIGRIISCKVEHGRRIEIQFADKRGSSPRNEAFADLSGFIMAALSYEGIVLA